MGKLKTMAGGTGMVLLLLLSSCSLEHKISKAKTLAYNNPDSFADLCARLFPVKDSVDTKTVYLPANNKDYTDVIDSLKKQIDQANEDVSSDTTASGELYRKRIAYLANQISSLRNAYKPCEKDTLRIVTTKTIENTARVTDLAKRLQDSEVKKANAEYRAAEAEKKARSQELQKYGLIAILVVLAIFFLKSRG